MEQEGLGIRGERPRAAQREQARGLALPVAGRLTKGGEQLQTLPPGPQHLDCSSLWFASEWPQHGSPATPAPRTELRQAAPCSAAGPGALPWPEATPCRCGRTGRNRSAAAHRPHLAADV